MLFRSGEPLLLTTFASLDADNNGTSLDVYLTSSEERSVRTSVITEALREQLPSIAGVERISVREQRSGPGGRAIDVQFTGSDASVLKQASEDLQAVLEGFAGVTAITDTLRYGDPELTMELTPRGVSLGLTLDAIGIQIRDAFEGRVVDTIAANDEEITIRLRRTLNATGSSALRDMWIVSGQGNFVPLSSLVKFSEQRGFSRIVR